MTLPNILYAEQAEQVVAGCALASRHGAALAARRLTASQFHDPRARGLFTAAVVCDLVDQDDRVHDCALDAGIDPRWAEDAVRGRPVQWDTSGSYAARVSAAATARRKAEQLLADLDELGLDITAVEFAR